jgi:GNAT superfamily N-acetyltransferase
MTPDATGVTFSSPTSTADARRILAAATPAIDSPTQKHNLSGDQLDLVFDRGFRRPEWVWEARDSDGRSVGVVAGWGGPDFPAPRILDVVAIPLDDAVPLESHGAQLLKRAIEESAALGTPRIEIIQFAPAVDPLVDDGVIAIRALIEACDYRMLVQRFRYELVVADNPPNIPPTRLRFEPVASADDPRLEQIMAELLVGSLDAHDIAALAKGDLAAVARETIAEYSGLDPIESFFLAIDESNDVVGLVIGGMRTSKDRGVASFIGVSHRHRGRGYAGQLLGFITARIIDQGARLIIGETDQGNVPMAKAFTFVGYPQTESRFDFVPAE